MLSLQQHASYIAASALQMWWRLLENISVIAITEAEMIALLDSQTQLLSEYRIDAMAARVLRYNYCDLSLQSFVSEYIVSYAH
jgi:hypothetical protein